MSRVLPILFNTEMVQAILDGRKTVARRICKDANESTVPDITFYDADKRTYAVHNYADKEHTDKLSIAERACPIVSGDILYVRETWALQKRGYMYKANWEPFGMGDVVKWRPSIHMPKKAARLWLKVTDIRVERLQDISGEELLKEGIEKSLLFDGAVKNAFDKFKELWNSTIKKSDLDHYGWDANPWVWVIEFERCEKPTRV